MGQVVYVGDIIIIKDIKGISTEENRAFLENGYPYFVTRVSDNDCFYIEVYGKEVFISDLDSKRYDLIEMVERVKFEIGDSMTITDLEKIKHIKNKGFDSRVIYSVVKIINNELIISSGDKELWIKGGEIRYIKPYIAKVSKDAVENIELNNSNNMTLNQELIDELLDKKDFDKLKELINVNK